MPALSPLLRYITARKKYKCAACTRPIARGTLHAYDLRQRQRYHRACVPAPPTYGDRTRPEPPR